MTLSWRILVALFVLTSCGKKDDKGGPTDGDADTDADSDADTDADTDTSSTFGVNIVAADGGTVAAGAASLEIPADSLSGDTEVTVVVSADTSALPDASTIQGSVYDFGPDGTTFDPPATLTLPLVGSPGTDQHAVVSWLDGSTWVDLSSTVTGSEVSAPVSHFTTFAVRFVAGAPITCEPFTPCGGDPTGTWTLISICADDLATGFPGCPESTISIDLTTSGGSITVSGNNTYSSQFTAVGSMNFTLPASCIPRIIPSCDALTQDELTCTGDKTVQCDCSAAIVPDQSVETGTWSVDGTTMTIVEDGTASEPEVSEFCVDGNQLSANTDGIIQVFQRQ